MNSKKIYARDPTAALRRCDATEVEGFLEPVLDDLRRQAQEYVEQARTQSTLRGYDSAYRRFSTWCSTYNLCPLPAKPETVALFLTSLVPRSKDQKKERVNQGVRRRRRHVHPTTVGRYVSAIKLRHDAAGHPSPTLDVRVRSVLRGVRRTHGVAPDRQAEPLLVGDLLSIIETLDPVKLIDVRDKAMLLIGFAGAFRRAELVALEVRDLAFRSDGLVVTLRRSKTDQEGKGREVGISFGKNGSCPVVSLRKWLTAAGVSSGPVLRSVDRHGNVGQSLLNPQVVCRVVKKLVPRTGLRARSFSGHSLRSGFATSAAAAGIEEREIAEVTGHQSLQVLRRYIRDGKILDGDLSRRLGL